MRALNLILTAKAGKGGLQWSPGEGRARCWMLDDRASSLVLTFAFCLFTFAFISLPSALCFAQEVFPEDPMAGARIFAQKGCVGCHAVGEHGGTVGPDLGRIFLQGSLLDIAGILWNHAPLMGEKMQEMGVARPTFTEGEMVNLIAFLTAYQYYLSGIGRPGDPERGGRLFTEKGCARCHAFEEAWDKPGPSLKRYRGYSPILMAQVMWNHGPEMEKTMRQAGMRQPKFEGDDMVDLLAYLRSQRDGAMAEPAYVEPGSPNRGRRLFKEKGCIRCHAIRGVGGRDGPDLGRQGGVGVNSRSPLLQSVSHVAGLMWNHEPDMWRRMQAKGIGFLKFSGGEMADLIAYLYFLNYLDAPGDPASGGRLFREKGCAGCHALNGVGGTMGPDLAQVEGLASPIEVIAALWSHATSMEEVMRERGVPWPGFRRGEMADLLEYLRKARASAGQ